MNEQNIITNILTQWKKDWILEDNKYNERLSVCDNCTHRKLVSNIRKCSLCGCTIVWKARYVKSKCPANNW